jgi:hypothetical protein
MTTAAPALAQASDPVDALNQSCYCRTLSPERLRLELERDTRQAGLMQHILQTRPHLFSSTVVFMAGSMAHQITEVVAAVERVCALPALRETVLPRSPAIAHSGFGPRGVCMGFDFHITQGGPKLIEINTNAGGLLLNVALAKAQVACCDAMQTALPKSQCGTPLEADVLNMFVADWQRQRGDKPLTFVAIVDEAPDSQYLAPEFELFQQLFQRNGIDAAIADPAELVWSQGQLWLNGRVVDMVYNRLTDFYLAEPTQQHLREAYQTGATVFTPSPHAHALFADKRNLAELSDGNVLESWGVSDADRATLSASVPTTTLVTPALADAMWAQRRQLFFKPASGYGAKAAYRGDKLTKRVWGEILTGSFVAQALVPPGERLIQVDGVQADLKFDVRAYTYAGKVQLLAARVYSGQTTNFRTQGGGFAPIIVLNTPENPHGQTTLC